MPNVCEIYTDVDGVFTADPRIVARTARKIDEIGYEEMMEMSDLGRQGPHAPVRRVRPPVQRARARAVLILT